MWQGSKVWPKFNSVQRNEDTTRRLFPFSNHRRRSLSKLDRVLEERPALQERARTGGKYSETLNKLDDQAQAMRMRISQLDETARKHRKEADLLRKAREEEESMQRLGDDASRVLKAAQEKLKFGLTAEERQKIIDKADLEFQQEWKELMANARAKARAP